MDNKSQLYKRQVIRSLLIFILIACISTTIVVFVSCSISYTQKFPYCSTMWFMLKNNDLSDKSLVPHLDLQYERCRKQILEHGQ